VRCGLSAEERKGEGDPSPARRWGSSAKEGAAISKKRRRVDASDSCEREGKGKKVGRALSLRELLQEKEGGGLKGKSTPLSIRCMTIRKRKGEGEGLAALARELLGKVGLGKEGSQDYPHDRKKRKRGSK